MKRDATSCLGALCICGRVSQNSEAVEIVVVNASSTDETGPAAEAVETKARKTVLASATGRGQAHNAGAAAATGDILFFLHGDTKPPLGWDKLIRDCLRDPTVVMGAFSFGVDRTSFRKDNFWGGCPTGMGIVEWFANFRAHRFQLPYGDQGLFMLRRRWELVGPMPEQLVMEDFEFLKTVRTMAIEEGKRIAVLNEVALCSGRRWEKNGVPYNTFANQWFVYAYTQLGYSDRDIYRLYYGREAPTAGATRLASITAPARPSAGSSSPRSPVGPAGMPPTLSAGALLGVVPTAVAHKAASAPSHPRSPVGPASLPSSLSSPNRRDGGLKQGRAQRRHGAPRGRAAAKEAALEASWPVVGAEELLGVVADAK